VALRSLLAQLVDLSYDLFDRSIAAIEDGTQSDGGGLDDSHSGLGVG
jgi:hypothetical protein